MKISGFTLIRNGVKFDYPFRESLLSLFPLVDELVINVGYGEDATLDQIRALISGLPEDKQKQVIIFESHWPLDDPEKKRGGEILSEQTNLALDRCTGDWCIYLQADEVFHEADATRLRLAITKADVQPQISGLLFDYIHFYGSYDVMQISRSVYRREVRAIRRSSGARSVGDAQSFRDPNGNKLEVAHSGARVFHYGWVRTPDAMKQKTYFMDQLYHGDPTAAQSQTGTPHTGENYRYKRIIGLTQFQGTHPQYMRERVRSKGWHWDLAHSPLEWKMSDLKKVLLNAIEKWTGLRLFEYRSYRLRNLP